MSASKKKKRLKKAVHPSSPVGLGSKTPTSHGDGATLWKTLIHQTKWHKIMIIALAVGLYTNTLTHGYTQDDAIVIYDNMFTQDGLSGIPGILQNDTFYGFFKEAGKANLVSGGRYRPFTLIMFAVEWQLFGKSPFVGHLINVMLYAILGLMLYKLLSLMILNGKENKAQNTTYMISIILMTCLIYVAHPLHTEAVANIKGRDEIMTLLGSVIALWALLKYVATNKMKWNILALISFFIALMSKENAITFLAVAPLSMILFRSKSFVSSLKVIWPMILATIAFLTIRTIVLGVDLGSQSMELMNNPFLKFVGVQWVPFSAGEKTATIIFTLGKYLSLLVFPHPLCHDYYPRAIEVMRMGDWRVLLSLALLLGLVFSGFWLWKRDRVLSFGILYFFITTSIISNVVFPIGTNMSERFMFMPSLGFGIVVAGILTKYITNKKLLIGLFGILILLMSIKTISRNRVWKDDFTLFTTDVKTNPRSAKLLNAAGGTLTTYAAKLPDSPKKTKALQEATGYLRKAIEIHPTYRNAYLLLGNAHFYLNEYEASISTFEKVLKFSPDFKDAKKNLPIVLRDAGKYYGEKMNNIPKSESYLNKALALEPNDVETLRLLGVVNGVKGDYPKALQYFKKVINIEPQSASAHANIGTTYQNMGDNDQARIYFEKAVKIDPKALNKLVGK